MVFNFFFNCKMVQPKNITVCNVTWHTHKTSFKQLSNLYVKLFTCPSLNKSNIELSCYKFHHLISIIWNGCHLFPKVFLKIELINLHREGILPPNDAYPNSYAAQEAFLGGLVFPLEENHWYEKQLKLLWNITIPSIQAELC